MWAVCLKETDEMIGDCGLTMQLIGGEIKPEIGYHIRADKQRNGFAKEASIASEIGLLITHRLMLFIPI